MTNKAVFAEIAVFLPLEHTLHYLVPQPLQKQIKIGQRVLVPVGKRNLMGGLIFSLTNHIPHFLDIEKLRSIAALIDDTPVVQPSMIPFIQWLSSYYVYPIGEAANSILPAGIKVVTSLRLRITTEGLDYLARSAVNPEEKAILEILKAHGKPTISRLVKSVGNPDCFRYIRRLRARGYIATEELLKTGRDKVKTRKVVHALTTKLPSDITISNRLQLLWDRLQKNHGVMRLSDLGREIPSAYYWVKKLKEAELIEVRHEKVPNDLFEEERLNVSEASYELTSDQKRIVSHIESHLEEFSFQVYLLHGVTGSGKTEIYASLIKKVLERKRQCLLLVPEIALSTHLEKLFYRRFGSDVAVLHSGLPETERFAQWKAILAGDSKIVLGARSGVFAPLPKLGLIVVDEEQDSSYKQDSRLCYHGRDSAIMRAKLENIPIILGSATPSLESYHHALTGKYELLKLSERIYRRPLPRVEIIDMRRQGKKNTIFSNPLLNEMKQVLSRKEQVLLFLNRRGFATFLMCVVCGEVLCCKRCSISLTLHKKSGLLRCHYCGFNVRVPSKCPTCGGAVIKLYGFGTEKIEEETRKSFPENHTKRLDSDTARNRRIFKRIFAGIRKGDIDILVGTQMVAKGHDFPGITLVGVVSADVSLQIPDFRASEYTFQTIMQVAGRAGRGDLPGKVLIQTYNPQHYLFRFLKTHDYVGFAQEELKLREKLDYPPFSRLSRILVSGRSEKKVKKTSQEIVRKGISLKKTSPGFSKVNILGPAEAPLGRLRNQYRWHLFIKAPISSLMHDFTESLLRFFKTRSYQSPVKIVVDVDPMSVL